MANKIKIIIMCCAWAVLGWLLYARTFTAPFLFDDEILIIHNPKVQDLAHGLVSLRNIFSYQTSRFLTNLTVAANYQAGHLQTFGYHLVNWFLHLLVTAGVWHLTALIMRIKKVHSSLDIPLWASLLFLAHPLHTESVSYINHRSSVLMTLFYLWSIIFYLRARILVPGGRAWGYFVLAGAGAVLSLLSKEAAWTVPLAWVLADRILLGRRTSAWVWAGLAALVMILALIFDLKLKEVLLSGLYSQSHRGDYLTLWTYLLTQLKVCLIFIRLMVLPLGLNADYDLPMAHSLLEPQTAAAALVLLLALVSAWAWRRRCWYWSWCVAAFFISLLSHFFPARYNVIAEHKLYLTLALIIPVLALWMGEVLKERFVLVCALLVAFYSVLTIARNEVWADPVALWRDTCRKSPQKPRPRLNLASALLQAGKVLPAREMFQEVIRLAPEYAESYINLAQIATDRGDLAAALAYSRRAIEVNPGFDIAYLQNGFLNDRLGRRGAAVASFQAWLKIHPDDAFIIRRVQILQTSNAP